MGVSKKGKSPRAQYASVIKRLRQTPVRIGASGIHGVGLIAVRPIPKGEKFWTEGPLKPCHDPYGIKHWELPSEAVKEMESDPQMRGVYGMVDAYLGRYENAAGKDVYALPESAFDRFHPIWYINDGGKENQNVKYVNLEKLNGGGLRALRNIKPGEELLANYNDMFNKDDPEYEELDCNEEEHYEGDKAWEKAKTRAHKLRKQNASVQNRLAKAEAALEVATKKAGEKEKEKMRKFAAIGEVQKHKRVSKLVAHTKTRRLRTRR